ncbi:MAG: peptidylprolyl isomerase, partial [Sciscionella sp.]
PCHRETTYSKPPLKVLQCGDPTGKGSGGPGYTIPDEKPKGLKPAPAPKGAPAGTPAAAVYPKGVLAMANTGQPNSGGSQFFMVYGNSQLPPDYTIFGTIDSAGLSTLNNIVQAGITPGTEPNTGQPNPDDGKPKKPVTIEKATIAG